MMEEWKAYGVTGITGGELTTHERAGLIEETMALRNQGDVGSRNTSEGTCFWKED